MLLILKKVITIFFHDWKRNGQTAGVNIQKRFFAFASFLRERSINYLHWQLRFSLSTTINVLINDLAKTVMYENPLMLYKPWQLNLTTHLIYASAHPGAPWWIILQLDHFDMSSSPLSSVENRSPSDYILSINCCRKGKWKYLTDS